MQIVSAIILIIFFIFLAGGLLFGFDTLKDRDASSLTTEQDRKNFLEVGKNDNVLPEDYVPYGDTSEEEFVDPGQQESSD